MNASHCAIINEVLTPFIDLNSEVEAAADIVTVFKGQGAVYSGVGTSDLQRNQD